MSTGRTSTQYLHKLLSSGTPKAIVVHEGVGAFYKPARVFRNKRFQRVIQNTPKLANHFDEISQYLEDNNTFIDTGWPSFSWIPYLKERYQEAFRFAHLVRNPFSVAASLSTHGIFEQGGGMFRKHGIIRPDLPNVKYPQFKEEFEEFLPFEKGLYHWLEVNRYLQEHHSTGGFVGLFRFEDLYGENTNYLMSLWSACGFDLNSFQKMPAFDRYQRTAATELTSSNQNLLDEVSKLSVELGYDEKFLEKCSNRKKLQSRYAAKRID